MTTSPSLDPRERDSLIRLHLERDFAPDGRPKCPELADMIRALGKKNGLALSAQSFALWNHTRDCPICRPQFEAMHAGEPVRRAEFGWDGAHLSPRAEHLLASLPDALRPPAGEAGATRRLVIAMAMPIAITSFGFFMCGVIGALLTSGSTRRELAQSVSAALIAPVSIFVAIYLVAWFYDATRAWKDRFVGYVIRATCALGLVGSAIVGTILLVGVDFSPGNELKIVEGMFASGAFAGVLLWVSDKLKGTGGYSGLSRIVEAPSLHRDPVIGAGAAATRRTLSSGLTFVAKILLPAVAFPSVALWAWYGTRYVPLNELLPWHGMPFSKGANPFHTMLASILLVFAFFLSIFRWTMRAKRVRIDGDTLLISNYLREIAVPLREVIDVGIRERSLFLHMEFVTIHLRTPTTFGKDLTFLPRLGRDWQFVYDLARDLRAAGEAARASAPPSAGPQR